METTQESGPTTDGEVLGSLLSTLAGSEGFTGMKKKFESYERSDVCDYSDSFFRATPCSRKLWLNHLKLLKQSL